MAKIERITVRLSPQLKAQLEMLAESRGKTASELIRLLIEIEIYNSKKES